MEINFVDIIQNEFNSRKENNKSYSLRAYARDLNLSPSRLSEVLSYKCGISEDVATGLSLKLGLNENETELFINMVNQKHARSKKKRREAANYLQLNHSEKSLGLERFELLSEWYYFAILSVMELDQFNGRSEWIKNRLGLDDQQISKALSTLENLKYIKKEKSKYILLNGSLTTTHDIESFALKKSHKQSLHQAIDKIDSTPINQRDITSMTMTFDKSKMDEAKNLITDFRRKFTDLMEDGKKEEVYNLNIQFVPITILNKGELS